MTFYNRLIADAEHEGRRLVRVERGSDRAIVTLDDPDKLNVLSAPLTRQLRTAIQELVAEPEIRTIVLTGAGDGFSAGGDLRMMERTPEALAAPEGTTQALTIEELAEPQCFTTHAFQRSVTELRAQR